MKARLITIAKKNIPKPILKRKLRGFQKSVYWVGQEFSLHETGFVLKIKCSLTSSLKKKTQSESDGFVLKIKCSLTSNLEKETRSESNVNHAINSDVNHTT